MPWGDAAWVTISYDQSPVTAVEHCERAIRAFGVFEAVDDLGHSPDFDAPIVRVRGHFRYGLKRLGQKTRVHVYVAGRPEQTHSFIGIESQGGDIWGTASRAGREKFLKELKKLGAFDLLEAEEGPPISRK